MKKSLTSVLELKKLRKDEEISKEEYHKEIVDVFSKNLDFKFSEVIGRGLFSTVLRVWNENAARGFAMRIILKEDVEPKEKEWGKLRHKNILTLLDTEDFPMFDLTWFLSPVVEMTLEDVLKNKIFRNDSIAIKLAVSWIKEITSALHYIHKKELAFLNLKLSNVMIGSDQSIKLFGFQRLNNIGQFSTGYDVPNEFKPPESYSADGRKLPVKGKEFDLWCLGVLSIEVFTGNYLSRNKPDEVCCWSDAIYPELFKILKKNNFNEECRCAFPNCDIKNKMLKIVRNFSRACLRLSPESRPCAGVLLRHRLLEDTGQLVEEDKIWKKELKPLDIKQKINDMNFLFETTAKSVGSYANITEPLVENDKLWKKELKPVTHGTSEKSVASQANIHEMISGNIDNKDATSSEIKNVSGNRITSEVDIHEIKTYMNNEYSTGREVNNASENKVTVKEGIHETGTYNIDNEGNTHNNVKDDFSDSSVEEISVVEQAFPTISSIFQDDCKMSEYQISSSMKTEFPDQPLCDYLPLLQEMFGRTIVKHCQKNLICSLLHTESVTKALRSAVEYERKCKLEAVYTENIDDVMSKQSSSRTNSFGYKIASKMFQFFI